MSLQHSVPTLMSKKIMLREINVPIDAPEWYMFMKEPDMHIWTGNKVPENIKETWDLLQKYKDIPQLIAWSIINNVTGKIIGIYWIWKPIAYPDGTLVIPAEAERLAKNYWRKGFMKESRKLVYNYCFNELNADEIHAQAWKDNTNSIKSLENAGHICYKEEEKMIEQYNSVHIECHFKLTRETWMKSKLMNAK